MNQALVAIGHELTRDKWLCFLLVMVLLATYVHTKNDAILQLLVTAVGVMAGLMRANPSPQNSPNPQL